MIPYFVGDLDQHYMRTLVPEAGISGKDKELHLWHCLCFWPDVATRYILFLEPLNPYPCQEWLLSDFHNATVYIDGLINTNEA